MQSVTLSDPATGNSAKILVGLGFNCFSWQVRFADGAQELLWSEPGFETGKLRASGSGIPLLFPFPGRIGHAQFEYGDKTYLLPHDPVRKHALHGFIFDRPWRLTNQTATRATATFQASIDDLGILNHWPSDFGVEATYELVGSELRFATTFRNTGYDPLPFGFGTHAYFRLPLCDRSRVANTVLTAPVDGEWKMDDMLTTGELAEVPAELTLASGLALGDHKFDTPYRLLASSKSESQTILSDPASGRQITQTFAASEFPHVVIYTPDHREAVCIEPYSCLPDPFSLEEQGTKTGLRILAPDQEFETQFVLAASEG